MLSWPLQIAIPETCEAFLEVVIKKSSGHASVVEDIYRIISSLGLSFVSSLSANAIMTLQQDLIQKLRHLKADDASTNIFGLAILAKLRAFVSDVVHVSTPHA